MIRQTDSTLNSTNPRIAKSYYSANLQNNNFSSFYFSKFNNVDDGQGSQGAGISVNASQFFQPSQKVITITTPSNSNNNNFSNGQNGSTRTSNLNQQPIPQNQINTAQNINPITNSQIIRTDSTGGQRTQIIQNQVDDPFASIDLTTRNQQKPLQDQRDFINLNSSSVIQPINRSSQQRDPFGNQNQVQDIQQSNIRTQDQTRLNQIPPQNRVNQTMDINFQQDVQNQQMNPDLQNQRVQQNINSNTRFQSDLVNQFNQQDLLNPQNQPPRQNNQLQLDPFQSITNPTNQQQIDMNQQNPNFPNQQNQISQQMTQRQIQQPNQQLNDEELFNQRLQEQIDQRQMIQQSNQQKQSDLNSQTSNTINQMPQRQLPIQQQNPPRQIPIQLDQQLNQNGQNITQKQTTQTSVTSQTPSIQNTQLLNPQMSNQQSSQIQTTQQNPQIQNTQKITSTQITTEEDDPFARYGNELEKLDQTQSQTISSSQIDPFNDPNMNSQMTKTTTTSNQQINNQSTGSTMNTTDILNANPLTVTLPKTFKSAEEESLFKVLGSLQESPSLIENPQILMILQQLQMTPDLKQNPYLTSMIQFIKQNVKQRQF